MIDITCESIKEKILLCEELTEAEKEHIVQCEECRALSLQTEKMLLELSKMSVPGIENGKIADSVMQEVRKTKSAAFPKFKLSNYIGTAAALVIVVALFAAGRFSDTKMSLDMANTVSDANTAPEISAEFHAYTEDENSDTTSYTLTPADEKHLKTSIGSAEREMSDEEAEFENPNAVENDADFYTTYDSVMFSKNDDNTQRIAVNDDKIEAFSKEVTDYAVNDTNAACGGASAQVKQELSEEEIFEESVSIEIAEENQASSIFDEVNFAEENTLEANVEIANSHVLAMFENANVLKARTLAEAGVSNEMFLEWLRTVANVGEYSFDSLYSYIQGNN